MSRRHHQDCYRWSLSLRRGRKKKTWPVISSPLSWRPRLIYKHTAGVSFGFFLRTDCSSFVVFLRMILLQLLLRLGGPSLTRYVLLLHISSIMMSRRRKNTRRRVVYKFYITLWIDGAQLGEAAAVVLISSAAFPMIPAGRTYTCHTHSSSEQNTRPTRN